MGSGGQAENTHALGYPDTGPAKSIVEQLELKDLPTLRQ